MSKYHYLAVAAALPLAAFVAWRLGDSRGIGLALGVAIAVGISLLGLVAQDRAAVVKEGAGKAAAGGLGSMSFMTAFALAFLVKLFALATGAIVLRMHEGLAALADWRAYLVGFAATVAWVLFVGAFRRRGVGSVARGAGQRQDDGAARQNELVRVNELARKDVAHKEAPASC